MLQGKVLCPVGELDLSRARHRGAAQGARVRVRPRRGPGRARAAGAAGAPAGRGDEQAPAERLADAAAAACSRPSSTATRSTCCRCRVRRPAVRARGRRQAALPRRRAAAAQRGQGAAAERGARDAQLGLRIGHSERFYGQQAVQAVGEAAHADGRERRRHRARHLLRGRAARARAAHCRAAASSSRSAPTRGRRRVRHASAEAVLRAYRAGESLVPLVEGGWARAAGGLARALRPRGRGSARGQGRARRAAGGGAARSRAAVRGARPPAAARVRGPARAGRRLRRGAGCDAARRPDRELRHYQERGVDWLSFLSSAGLGACSPTTWASARRCRRCARCSAPCAGRGADQRALQLAARDRALPPGAAREPLPRARAARSTPSADVTLTSYAILRLDVEHALGAALGHGRPRRGADHQEPGQPGRARRVRARRRASA